MSQPITERVAAEIDGDFVVFLIGMRINKLWKIWQWFPVVRAMARMLPELAAHPELGMLTARGHYGLRNLMVLQYWRSAEHLLAYAHGTARAHLPAWQAFNRRIGSNGDVGIWHETYVVPQGNAESIYVNMPPYGLGLAGELFPSKGPRASAGKRLSRRSAQATCPMADAPT